MDSIDQYLEYVNSDGEIKAFGGAAAEREVASARLGRYSTEQLFEYESEARRAARAEYLRSLSAADGLVSSHISHREGKNSVVVHAGMCKVKRLGSPARGGGRRGKVVGFSKAARGRMLVALAQTKGLDLPGWFFCTLTMPDDFPAAETWHVFLDVFIKRLERKFPETAGFWRLELKRRLSGSRRGELAPHVHLLVKLENESIKGERLHHIRQWFSRAWYEVVGSGSSDHLKAGTNVRTVFSRSHASRYVSKYASKESDNEDLAVGRRWGCFGDLDRSPDFVGSMTMREVLYFKLLSVCVLQRERSSFAHRLARSSPAAGFKVFGLGSQSRSPPSVELSEVMQLIRAAADLSYEDFLVGVAASMGGQVERLNHV